jgi:hypothetical protein
MVKYINIPVMGDTLLEPDEFLVLNLTNPTSVGVLDQNIFSLQITDDDGVSTLSIGSLKSSVTEKDSGQTNTLRFEVTRNRGLSTTAMVDYSTQDGVAGKVIYSEVFGSARANIDYLPTSGTLTFNPGVSSQIITVTVIGDLFAEPPETFSINLSKPVNSTLWNAKTDGIIYDDDGVNDGKAIVIMPIVSILEGNDSSENRVARFTVRHGYDLIAPLTVDFATVNNTALAGFDYVPFNGTLTFKPGEKTKFIDVEIIEETLLELDENFFVNLTNASAGTIAENQGKGTILADDPFPVDTELSLLIDISASVDSAEYQLQLEGYARAFDNPDLFNTFIASGEHKLIAVNLILWSSERQQQEAIGWSAINNVSTSQAFASKIRSLKLNRPFQGETASGSAIAFAVDRFFTNIFLGTRQVIDISGDGIENDGIDTAFARDAALAKGIDMINGIVIGDQSVEGFYRAEIAGGNSSFVLRANDFSDFQLAIQQKIFRELGAPPLLAIIDRTITEGNAGTKNLVFTVSLDRPDPTVPITVDFTTVAGTATANTDYIPQSETLTFSPNTTTQTITIQIKGETEVEANETFSIQLSNASSNAFILDGIGISSILDDDNSSPVAVGDNYITDEDTTLTITLPGVLSNDTDPNGSTLEAILPATASNGVLEGNTDGSFAYTPLSNFYGTDSFTYQVNDNFGGTASATVTLLINPVNDMPIIDNAIIDQSYFEDLLFNFAIPANTFTDIDVGDTLTYTATLDNGNPLPNWLTFNATTRTFSGIPDNNNVGSNDVKIIATDGSAASISDVFKLTVANVNDVPIVQNAIADQSTTTNNAFNFTIPNNTFSDIDIGDSLTYAATLDNANPLPDWLSFNATSRTFSGTPSSSDMGQIDLKVIATDSSSGSVSDIFKLTVNNTINNPPVVGIAIADQFTPEDVLFNYTIPANTFNDIDAGDTLTYTVTLDNGNSLPTWLTFNSTTRTFSGTPGNSNAGVFDIIIIASDSSEASVIDSFKLTVVNVNDAPVVQIGVADQSTQEDSGFSFTFQANTFTDKDVGDTLTYTVTLDNGNPLPNWLKFNATTRTLNGTPDNNNIGAIDIKVIATDSSAASVSDLFKLTVANVNDVPIVQNAITNQKAIQGSDFNFQFAANTFSDIDVGDSLTYDITGDNGTALPSWLSFNPATRTFGGKPANQDVGNFSVKVTATDTSMAAVSNTFNITIAQAEDNKRKAELENLTLNIIPDQLGYFLNPLKRKLTPEEIVPLLTASVFPLGILSFEVVGIQNSFQTEVQIILPPNNNVNSYTKLMDGKWQGFLYDGETGAEFKDLNGDGSNDVLLHLKDGARGDGDGLANSIIADYSAPTVTTPGLYQIKGVFNAATIGDTALQARWLTSPNGNYEFGVIAVDDPYGCIGNLLPGTEGYLAAALVRRTTIFNGRSNASSSSLSLDNITGNFSKSESQSIGQLQNIYFKSGYGIFYLSEGEKTTLSLDNQFTNISSDRGYNLLNFTDSQGRAVKIEIGTSTFLTPGVQGGSVNLEITLRRVAEYKNALGFYKVDDLTGGLDTNGDGKIDLITGQAGYAQEALRRAQSLPELQAPDNNGTSNNTVQFATGQLFGLFVIPNASVSDVLDKNPTNQSLANKPVAFFSYANANPDSQIHMTRFGSGNTSQFGFEDLMGGGDRDFNDLIVSMQVRA